MTARNRPRRSGAIIGFSPTRGNEMAAPLPAPPSAPVRAQALAELDAGMQARMVQALRVGLATRHGRAVGLIETHISYVLLFDGQACKIKKALKNDFLDASTLALRQQGCAQELRLNRRYAPALYLGIVPVTGSVDAPQLGGGADVLDVAVMMRAFPQDALWDLLAARGALGPAQIDDLAQQLARFHDIAAVAPPTGRFGSPAQVRAPMRDNLDALQRMVVDDADHAALQRLRDWEAGAFAALAPVMAQRLARGRVRECHGDLHLGNVAQVDGSATMFDGIDFNDDFRWIDVASELAFIAMDLHAHGLAPLAHRVVDAWLGHSGDYDAARLLPYYLVHRALVRAKVAWLRAAQCSAQVAVANDVALAASASQATAQAGRYLALALRFIVPARPALLATHGFSGSGKSTLTQGLVDAAGAVRIRADAQRKRLFGLQPLAASRPDERAVLYGSAMSTATYSRLRELAVPVLQGGMHVVLDATFLKRSERDAARALATAQRVPFRLLDFPVDAAVLRQRLRARVLRGGEVSEADEGVLQAQLLSAEPLQPDELATVHVCRQAADVGTGAPAVDWQPLLCALADESAPMAGAADAGRTDPAGRSGAVD
jgi:uncharacterized protein